MITVQQQGEVRIEMVDCIPECLPEHDELNADGAYIISHSEKGHHHVLERSAATVYRSSNANILYAIVENPTAMKQTATVAHKEAPMAPGMYRLTISREYDPFADEVRRVAD